MITGATNEPLPVVAAEDANSLAYPSGPLQTSRAGEYGRRISLGGGGMMSAAAERRNSFGPLFIDGDNNHNQMMTAMFGPTSSSRRPSGFTDMDFLDSASRRDSLDSTTAVLDAAMMDLTRRRLSIAVGPQQPPPPQQAHSVAGSYGYGNHRRESIGDNNQRVNSNSSSTAAYSASLAARQQQLKQQQRELEQKQRELELQRQQLIAGMQEQTRSAHMFASSQQQNQHMMTMMMMQQQQHYHNQQQQQQQQWWVCQICNSKAFASQGEVRQHEMICRNPPPSSSMNEPYRYNGMAMTTPSDHFYESHHPSTFSFGPASTTTNSYDAYAPYHPRAMADSSSNTAATTAVDNRPSSAKNHSDGPFAEIKEPMPLAMPSDKEFLTPLHCFVRRYCVEVFTASEKDVSTPSKGKRKPIQVGQLGIRCPHCRSVDGKQPERGSVYYPTSISSIYNATMNLLQRHLHNCSSVPADIMRRYETLKGDDARSGTSKRYWIESSIRLGLVDTHAGICFSELRPPPSLSTSSQQRKQQYDAGEQQGNTADSRRNSNDLFSSNSNAVGDFNGKKKNIINNTHSRSNGLDVPSPASVQSNDNDAAAASNIVVEGEQQKQSLADTAPLVTSEDESLATGFSYQLMSQMQPCVFMEADRLGKRKGLPPGFPGLACRHCFGGFGSGRFFPSSIKTLSDTSKTLNVLYNHMMRCRKCPQEVRETLEKLRATHDDERSKMRFGSQKAFFGRIWQRLHKNGPSPTLKRATVMPHPPASNGMMGATHLSHNPMTQSVYPPPMMDHPSPARPHPYGPPMHANISQCNSFAGLADLADGPPKSKRQRTTTTNEENTNNADKEKVFPHIQ